MGSNRLMVGLVAPALGLGLLTFGWTLWSAAYGPVPEADAYQGESAGRPQVSTLGTTNDVQGAVALGAVVSSEPTPTPTSTPPPGSADDSEWGLVIDGLVQSPLSLTFDDLAAMPTSIVYAKLYCVGSPTTPLEGNWVGVRLGLLLQEAGVSPEAVKVAFYASDGFTTDLTVTTAMRDDVILAYEKDGQPLTEKIRLVVPGKWGYKWISKVTHIELVNYDFLGYYESNGYSDEADIPGYWPSTADVKIVDQHFVNPPTQVNVSEDVPITLEKTLHNNGPYGPVDASTTTTITVPPGCTASPNPHTQLFSNVPVSVDVLHHEPFTIHCSQLGPHTFRFDDKVEVTTAHVQDLVSGNNARTTQLTITAVGAADVKIASASFVDPPTKIPLGQDTDVTLRKVIHNNGPTGPVDIAIVSNATPPTGCTIVPKTVPSSLTAVPVSVDQVVNEVWTIRCTVAGLKTWVFDNSIDVATVHVYDPNKINNTTHKLLTVRDPFYPYWGDEVCDGKDNNGDTVVDEGWDMNGNTIPDCLDPALDTDHDGLTNDVDPDADGDGWTNAQEAFMRTDPLSACPLDSFHDAWPPDINNDREVNIQDVVAFRGPLNGAYDRRYDLKTDGEINIADVIMYRSVIGKSCTP